MIVEGGPEAAAPETLPRWAVVVEHVQGHTTDQGQVFRRVVGARPTSIFAKLHVQDPVLIGVRDFLYLTFQ